MSNKKQKDKKHIHNRESNFLKLDEVRRRAANKGRRNGSMMIEIQPATEENRQTTDTKVSLKDFAKEANNKVSYKR